MIESKLIILTSFYAVVLGGVVQPLFIVGGALPEFASFSSTQSWCPNECSFPPGSQNFFFLNVGGGVVGMIYSARNDVWVGVADNAGNSLCWTPDGTNWGLSGVSSQACSRPGGNTVFLSSIGYHQARDFWLFGTGAGSANIFWRFSGPPTPGSPINPTGVVTSAISVPVNGIYCSDGVDMCVAVGGDGMSQTTVAWSSPDGMQWTTALPSPFGINGHGNGVVWSCSQNIWVAVGLAQPSGSSIVYSFDAKSWFQSTGFSVTSEFTKVAVSLSGTFVAVGGPQTTAVARSVDGIFWSAIASPFSSGVQYPLNGIGYSEQLRTWILSAPLSAPSGTSKSVVFSFNDGLNWANQTFVFGDVSLGGVVGTSDPPPPAGSCTVTSLSGTLSSSVLGNVNVDAGAVLTVASNVTIGKTLTISGTVIVSGAVSLQNINLLTGGQLTVGSDARVVLSGSFVVLPNSTVIRVALNSVPQGATTVVVSNVVTYSSTSSTGNVQNAVIAYSNATCYNVTGFQPQVTSSSLSVTVNVAQIPGCTPPGQGGLSPGAIAGIVVGAVVGGALVATAIVLITKYVIHRHTEKQKVFVAMKNAAQY